MRPAMVSLLGHLPGDQEQQSAARRITTLPMRLGGLGIRSAARVSPAAYWASWADALAMLQARLPRVTANIVGGLVREAPLTRCVGELQESARSLDHSWFVGRPEWTALRDGARSHEFVAEPGEWQHGWQYFASSCSESHFRETVVLPQSSSANQAHLSSHSGHGSSSVLCGCSTTPEFQIQPTQFWTIVLERLRLPLQITEAVCECGVGLDKCGCHRAACPCLARLHREA